MLNLDVVPSKMTGAEIKSWLNECAAEIEKAYDDDNVAYAQKLDSIYQVVKQMGIEKLQEESFTNYLKYTNFLNESVTEEGNQEIDLLEVDENIESLKKKLQDCEINVSASATLDENLKVVDFSPITVDIAFKLAYIDEKQHIVLTYTASEIPTFLDIESIPERDYKNTPTESGMEVTFKSITNLADELTGQVTFKESIEWPFEMDFKSAAVEKKFNKNASLVAKIVALLGKEQLINKVSGYQICPQPEGVIGTKDLQCLLHHRALLVEHREVFAHIPQIAGYQGFQLHTKVGQRLLFLSLITGFDVLLISLANHRIDQALGYLIVGLEIGKRFPTPLQFLTMIIDITEILLDDDSLCSQFAMILRIKCRIQRHKLVRHDTTATIDCAMLAERLILQRISKMNTIGICQFAAFQAVEHIHRVVLIAALRVRFLNTTT